MSQQQETAKEQVQMPTPLVQNIAKGPPSLQTPLHEEKNKNRDRETTTPTSEASGQPRTKRQRLNPLSEEEFVEETIYSQREERVVSQQTFPLGGTSTSSQRPELERQQSAKVSSLRPPGKDASDINRTFTEIKAKMIH